MYHVDGTTFSSLKAIKPTAVSLDQTGLLGHRREGLVWYIACKKQAK